MKTTRITTLTALVVMLAMTTLANAGDQDFPEVTEEGLQRVHDSKMALVYADPDADLSQYDAILMTDPYVAFRKNWLRDQRTQSVNPLRVTTNDVEKIKKNLSEEFKTVFTEKLEAAGYALTDSVGESVLLIRPAIINLDISAPDTPSSGRSYQYTQSAGEMTLYIELYDSVSGDLIAKALDRKQDRSRSGYYTWTNSVTNRKAADRILNGWADILVDALDDARQYVGVDDSPSE
jgi:hypothetical protein